MAMRKTNPRDTIHFFYDSSLLSEQAEIELTWFCGTYNIVPMNVRDLEVMEQLKENTEELELYKLYLYEIDHYKKRNLGAASDILRWLSPVYRSGTYSDFDTKIDTRNLPDTVEVESPLLFNMGSVENQSQPGFLNTIRSIDLSTNEQSGEQEGPDDDSLAPPCSTTLNASALKTVSAKIELEMVLLNTDIMTVVNEKAAMSSITEVQKKIIEKRSKEHRQPSSNQEDSKLKVMKTTGPALVQQTIFGEVSITGIPKHQFKKEISPLSYRHYTKLSAAFSSENGIPLHTTREAQEIYLGCQRVKRS